MLTTTLKQSLDKSLSGSANILVVGKTKAANQIYEILITSKEIKREAYVIWNEQWNLEIGKDENVKLAQTLKGNIKIISHFSEEGCAELNMTKKVMPIKLEIKEPVENTAVIEKAAKIILEQREEIAKSVEVHQELVKDVTEERLRRKSGKTGTDYRWDYNLK